MNVFRGIIAVVGFSLISSSSFAAPSRTASAAAPAPSANVKTVAPSVVVPQSEYKIGPQDTLVVDVFQVPDLSRTVQVDGKGLILLPLRSEERRVGKECRSR